MNDKTLHLLFSATIVSIDREIWIMCLHMLLNFQGFANL